MRWLKYICFILVLKTLSGFSQKDGKLDSLISVYTKAQSDTDRIYKYADIGSYLIDKGKYKEALPYFTKIVQTFSASYPKRGIDAKNKITLIYILTEAYNKADSLANSVIEASLKFNYPKGIGWANRNLGLVNTFLGKYTDAVTYNLKALKVWEDTKNQKMTSVSNSDLGIVFYYQGNYEKAAFYWENALKLKPDTTTADYMADLANLSGAYLELGNYANASESVKKVLRYYSNDKKSDKYNSALNSLANIENRRKNYNQAITYYTESLKNREEGIGRMVDLAMTYVNLCGAYTDIGKPKEALEYGLKGYQKAIESGDKHELLHVYNGLKLAYAKGDNFKKSYEFAELYNTLKDSLNNIESQKQVNELDKQYQTEKKEKDNQILSKQLEIQQIQGKQQQFFLIVSGVVLVLICALSIVLFNQNKQKRRVNTKLEVKNQIIEEQHKNIIDSINYAKRIQQAVLKEEEHVSKHLPPHFILFKPKDIVSGDFYWALEKGEYLYVTAADCTGHGVPGAFLTMLGISYLNEINARKEILTPAEILDELRAKIVNELSKHGTTKDGMDISLMRMHLKTREIMWAGAFNPLWYIESGILKEIKANKQPIGYVEGPKPFTNHILHLNANDTIYLFTDGFADQFGGPKGKKYKYKQLEENLLTNSQKPFEEQKEILSRSFDDWKLNLEQVDDVTIIGISVA